MVAVRIWRRAGLPALLAVLLQGAAAFAPNTLLTSSAGSRRLSRPVAGAGPAPAPLGGPLAVPPSLRRGQSRATRPAGGALMLCFTGVLPSTAPLVSGLLKSTVHLQASTLAPLIGSAIGVALVLSSYPALRRQKALGKLGDINPLPYPAMLGNAASWLMYGCEISNLWVIGPNLFNLLAGAYYTKSGMKLAEGDDRLVIFKTLASYAGLFALVHGGLRSGLIQMSQRLVFGLMANFCLLFFYAAPLATLSEVIRTKDASSIDPLLSVCGMINGFFWFLYGWGVRDVFIWLPNIVGFALNALTAAVRVQYGEGTEPEPLTAAVTKKVEGSFTLVRQVSGQMGARLLEQERRYHVLREHRSNLREHGQAALMMAQS